MQQKKRHTGVFVLKLAIAAAVLVILAKTGIINVHVLRNVSRGGWWWVVFGGSTLFFGIIITAWRWLLLVRAQGIRIPFLLSVRLTFLGMFFSTIMPGATGGDLAKAYYVYRWGTKRAAAVTTIFVDRVIGLYAMFGVGTVMVLAQARLFWSQPATRPLVYLLPLLFLGSTLAMAALFTKPVRYMITATRTGPPIPFGQMIYKVYQAVDLYRGAKSVIVLTILLSVLNTVTLCIGCQAFGKALGDTAMSTLNYFQAVPIGMVVNGLPILPMGLGVGEVAFDLLFKIISASQSGAENSVLFHVVALFWSAVGGIFYLSMKTDIKDAVSEDGLELGAPRASRKELANDYSLRHGGRELIDYVGCVHLHTRYSDGSDSMERIVKEAKRSDIDFFVVADHDTLRAAEEGWEGWQDGVLSIVGVEISSLAGHCLVFGLRDCAGLKQLSPPEYLAEIRRRGALAFVAHPTTPRRPEFRFRAYQWEFWNSPDFDGLEIWTYMHDWVRSVTWKSLVVHLLDPTRGIRGPDPQLLARWDALCQTRRIVGIGTVDNHALKLPFQKLPVYVVNVLPHRFAFQTVRTHVLCERFTSDSQADVERVVEALRLGRCYLAYDYLADSRGFRFEAHGQSATFLMGDEARLPGEYGFRVASPAKAELKVLRDGSPIAAAESDILEVKVTEPGVYRAEARLKGQPWVFTNPIYLRPA